MLALRYNQLVNDCLADFEAVTSVAILAQVLVLIDFTWRLLVTTQLPWHQRAFCQYLSGYNHGSC